MLVIPKLSYCMYSVLYPFPAVNMTAADTPVSFTIGTEKQF